MLSVIIPTYNEKDNIKILIDRLEAVLGKNEIPFEIIVVDDDSPDLTWQVVEELVLTKPHIRLYRRVNQRGLSSAVIQGFSQAKGDYLAVIDADLQHDETILPEMYRRCKENEIVIASRKVENGGIEDWSKKRQFVSWVAGTLAVWVLKVKITDPMSGFFMLPRESFNKCVKQLNPKGFKVLLEIIHKLQPKKVSEVGFMFKSRQHGESKLSTSVIFDYLISLYELKFGKVLPASFLQYCLVGGLGVIVNMGVFELLYRIAGQAKEVSVLAGISVAMIFNFILNDLWTFKRHTSFGIGQKILKATRFLTFCSVGALINYSVVLFMDTNFSFLIEVSVLIGIVVSTLWNYWSNKTFTWHAE
jgi:dolichol-phosphate mannosyltransferase